METPDPSISHLPIRRLCQQATAQATLPVITQMSNSDTLDANNDAPPKYSPPPSYGKAVGLRVAKALRNSIRRSVRRFRRNEPSINIESNQQNMIPTVSLSIEPAFAQNLRINSQTVNRNVNEFIRSTIHRTHRSSQSEENLMLSSLNVEAENENQSASRNIAMGNLI